MHGFALAHQTCLEFHHQAQCEESFLLQLEVPLSAWAQGHCLEHRKIPIRGTALHL